MKSIERGRPGPLRQFYNREFTRFVFFGFVNTFLSYVLYLIFLWIMSYLSAYTWSYILGIFISYYLNSRYVFKEAMSLKKAFQFPSVYAVSYVLGMILLYLCVDRLGMSEELAPLVGILVTVPVSYLMSRWIIKERLETG